MMGELCPDLIIPINGVKLYCTAQRGTAPFISIIVGKYLFRIFQCTPESALERNAVPLYGQQPYRLFS